MRDQVYAGQQAASAYQAHVQLEIEQSPHFPYYKYWKLEADGQSSDSMLSCLVQTKFHTATVWIYHSIFYQKISKNFKNQKNIYNYKIK